MNIPLSKYDIGEHNTFCTSSGATVGLESAYYLTHHIGIGGRFTASGLSVIANGDEAADNTLDALSAMGGVYFNLPFSTRWSIGSKLLGGVVHFSDLQVASHTVPSNNGAGFGSGLSLTYQADSHFALRFFTDYSLLPSHSSRSGEHMHQLTCGSAVTLLF